jgi:hypothetical protein
MFCPIMGKGSECSKDCAWWGKDVDRCAIHGVEIKEESYYLTEKGKAANLGYVPDCQGEGKCYGLIMEGKCDKGLQSGDEGACERLKKQEEQTK